MERRKIVLVAGDAVALIVFAVIGLLSHDKGITATGLLRDAVPVLAGWFAAAALFGTYTGATRRSFLLAWVVGITGGVVVRGLVLHRHLAGRYLTFVAVTLVVTLALLVAWRAILSVAARTAAPLS